MLGCCSGFAFVGINAALDYYYNADKPLSACQNTFTNLAIPLFTSMEVEPPKPTKTLIKGEEWKWAQVRFCWFLCAVLYMLIRYDVIRYMLYYIVVRLY